ncbi:M56 family metallopeptidase [Actinokineospora xionganensis]|uniref:M56 family metallopeptidase n=1 Tax=Actinokineospora xionganensis TaxID=2684470 RepID=A0ABR7KZS9_9PSEU|nr:M56 family metallopeptidase [Actinokineospora xionganensis]MBC6445938.1 M56 family metallopeptidase [Actinokineospora xionganensis]
MIVVAVAIAVSVAILTVVVPLLRRVTERGHSPRLSAAAWLVLASTVLVSWAIAGVGALWLPHQGHLWTSMRIGLGSLTGSARAADVLRHVVGIALIVPLGRFAFFIMLVLTRMRHGRSRKRSALRLFSSHIAGVGSDVVEIPSEVPMVYCMPGKPDVVVVTSAAKNTLDAEEFAAVLAHERAHLAERHHVFVAVARAIGMVSRRVWLFPLTERLVRQLVEMRADDVAVRQHAPGVLSGAMRKLSTLAPPATALGVAGPSVAKRMMRIADPPTRRQRVLAGIGSCSFVGLSFVTQATLVALPVIAMTAGNTCLFMAG